MLEENFILNAARINLSEKNIANLKDISSKRINWSFFEKQSSQHRVNTLIYYSLLKYNIVGILPQEIFDKFRLEYLNVLVKNTILLDSFSKLSNLINHKVIPLKGVDLIQRLYPNIAIRSMYDIDILVEKEYAWSTWYTIKESKQLSKTIEGKDVYKSSIHKKYNRSVHLPPLYTKKYRIEIHYNLFQDNCLYDITKHVWLKSIFTEGNIYRLSNEMMLMHLCSHFYKHYICGTSYLRMLCDINELILKFENSIDWQEINIVCNNTDLKNKLTIALSYCFFLLNTPVPKTYISDELNKNKSVTISSLLINKVKKENTFEPFLLTFKNINNPFEKTVYIYRIFVPVKEWIADQYNTVTKMKLIAGYLKHWRHLTNKHILKNNEKTNI